MKHTLHNSYSLVTPNYEQNALTKTVSIIHSTKRPSHTKRIVIFTDMKAGTTQNMLVTLDY